MREPRLVVIHAALGGTHLLHVRSLESGDEALVLTEPIKRKRMPRRDWEKLRDPRTGRFCTFRELQTPSDHP